MSNENNHFSKMTTFEQWNYGDGQRVILHSINKGIIRYEKVSHSSFDFAFFHHPQAILMYNDLLTKAIEFLRGLAMVVEYLYHWICLECFGSRRSNKDTRSI